MSEQEIDAEVSRYEPYFLCEGAWVWFIWAPTLGVERRPEDVPIAIHRKLQFRAERAPTREAAFADLRQAIRAAHAQGG